ncbi:MAG: hypothetical protein ABH842_02605 [Candidatus Micrarchaeota archaeon]
MDNLTTNELEKKWNSSCKLIFNQEIGDMNSYEHWLTELVEPINYHKSSLSGKDVISAPNGYSKESKWLAFDEVDFNKKFEPLNINEIKDIDSLVQAISERWYYSGNIFFGNSAYIEKSSNINDSFYIFKSARFGNSKYLAHCTIGRQNQECFGCNVISESKNCIKCYRSFRNSRSFELWMSQNCSGCYYSFGLNGCIDCIFCFNVESRRQSIGNLTLERDKYISIKSKLLEEIAEKLQKDRRLISLLEIIDKVPHKGLRFSNKDGINERNNINKNKIENAFSQTTSTLFSKKLEGIDDYSDYLNRHIRITKKYSSAFSGDDLFIPDYANYSRLPKERLLSSGEAHTHSKTVQIKPNDLENLNLDNVHEKIGRMCFFNAEMFEGTNLNMIECAVSVDSADCYRSSVTEYSKHCGYSFWPRSSQYLFGCDSPFDSSFCINCYSCTSLIRCFEVDCSGYCSDLYFGHNCENVRDSMFCFNVKNLRNAIGNVPLQSDSYKKIKVMLQNQIHDELQSKKFLEWDIYSLNRGGRHG